MRSWRVPLVCLVPGVVLMLSWLRLEHPQRDGWRALALLLLAVAPAAAPRAWQRLALFAGAAMVALAVASRAPSHHPWRAASRLWDGFLDAYDTRLPFDPSFHAHFHALVLLAGFGFAAGVALAASFRRPLVAVARLHRRRDLAGDAADERPRPPARRGRPRRRAVPAGRAARSPAAVARTGGPARRRPRRRGACGRDPARRRQEPVPPLADVEADLAPAGLGGRALRLGLELRRLQLAAEDDDRLQGAGARAVAVLACDDTRPLHRRALGRVPPAGTRQLFDGRLDLTQNDPLAPQAARDPATWTKAQFEIAAFADDHVVAPSVPVGYEPAFSGADFYQGGSATLAGQLERGQRYAAWSYSPHPTSAQLAAAGHEYGEAALPYLEVYPELAALPFGSPQRAAEMRRFLVDYPDYRPLYEQARRVVGNARSPYAAVLALESWLRGTGGFTYTQRPPLARGEPLSTSSSARSAGTASTSPARWR